MPSAMPERRSAERFLVTLGGWFTGELTGDPIACTVSDLSETGMRLVIPSPADVPLEFELKIPDAQAVARVRLVWTTESQYGARFTGQPGA
ncbi:PilZ domain-containing protein [Microvirga sp. BT688]|uniref:PilZ domain-containing protein n=1 Tax=Microvirga sp. TaxID=1873136 RepID=UPI001684F6E2|nr:PilZ domain-containing protein [Microvirga sp.]